MTGIRFAPQFLHSINMTSDSDPATKSDLSQLGLELTQVFDTKLETTKDEIMRAFQMTEENIRKDCAHADKVVELESHVTTIESHLGISKH